MQKLIIITLSVILASGLLISYMMYRQLGTAKQTLTGTPVLVSNGSGGECGQVDFSVGARSVGSWFFRSAEVEDHYRNGFGRRGQRCRREYLVPDESYCVV